MGYEQININAVSGSGGESSGGGGGGSAGFHQYTNEEVLEFSQASTAGNTNNPQLWRVIEPNNQSITLAEDAVVDIEIKVASQFDLRTDAITETFFALLFNVVNGNYGVYFNADVTDIFAGSLDVNYSLTDYAVTTLHMRKSLTAGVNDIRPVYAGKAGQSGRGKLVPNFKYTLICRW